MLYVRFFLFSLVVFHNRVVVFIVFDVIHDSAVSSSFVSA